MDEWSKYQMQYNENGQRKAGREWNSPHMNIITLNAWKGPERLVPYPFTKKPYHVFHMSTFTDVCRTPYECEMVLQAFKTRNESKKKADLRFK
ncbi:uncharacterized protein LOC128988172 isoform X2 [Macrosteles quadrilineatus]|uniref:uncharacterized protein LOC128988172 isoform X2 n=1 Tax=Macrosteles quadrilineatus TaxID=74068 RepID=UPI0023E28458|nr:uncharacterized protein LOC128988172 isoform X2 [Macrosteles quadrilineatus]